MWRAFILCLAMSTAGCRCAPDTPTAVRFRLTNVNPAPLYVDDTTGQLGLTVRRNVGGTWVPFVEQPGCACLSCDVICTGCACAAGAKQVRKLPAGEVAERTWAGVVQLSGAAACSAGNQPACLIPENASPDETFQVEFCYQTSAKGLPAFTDGGVVAGTLFEQGLVCSIQEFRPLDGTVDVGPKKGTACAAATECFNPGDLCLDGTCTSTCPAHDIPELGSAWSLRISAPDDQGFFTTTVHGGKTVWQGSGTVSSVIYQGGVLNLRLNRPSMTGPGPSGAVFVGLPGGLGPALTAGVKVEVTLIDGSTPKNPENRALVVRDEGGALLLAADTAQNGPLLDASHTAPLTVSTAGIPVACDVVGCGKVVHAALRVTGTKAPLSIVPGRTTQAVVDGSLFRVLSVGNGAFQGTNCAYTQVSPYALWKEPAP